MTARSTAIQAGIVPADEQALARLILSLGFTSGFKTSQSAADHFAVVTNCPILASRISRRVHRVFYCDAVEPLGSDPFDPTRHAAVTAGSPSQAI